MESASLWSHVEKAPDGACLTNDDFENDINPNKINLTIGVYRNDIGEAHVLPSVKKAERILFESELDKEYAPVTGVPMFCESAIKLALGNDMTIIKKKCATVQTLAGTGALRTCMEFLASFHAGPKCVWVSSPTWVNHANIVRSAGMKVASYIYYDPTTCSYDERRAIEDILRIPEKSIILLQVCGHNPTGCDPSPDQWERLSQIIKVRKLFPVFDMAYQGIVSGDLDADAYPVRLFIRKGHQLALAQSFSKNMGLYGDRVGCLTFLCANLNEKERILSHLKWLIRSSISCSPINGARLATLILNRPDLKKKWISDLKEMTHRIVMIRNQLFDLLIRQGSTKNWNHISNQTGLFCYTGLNDKQIERMSREFSVYISKDGRISLASLPSEKVWYLAMAMHEVTK